MKALRANSTLRIGFLNKISFLVGYFKKISAFLVYSICFHETVHDKCRRLDKSGGQNENVLERGFVKLCLKSVNLNNWPSETWILKPCPRVTGTQVKLQTKNSRKAYFKNVKQVAKLQGYSGIRGQIFGFFFLYESLPFERV